MHEINYRLAQKLAHARPYWHEPTSLDDYRTRQRERLAFRLFADTSAADLGADSAAHLADCNRTATLARLIALDWLPARALEFIDTP